MAFDLVVIGGGPAGYTGAIRAAKYGMKVALVEKAELGGTCLNRGCIPTKALLHSSEFFYSRSEWQSLGIITDGVNFDEDAAYKRKESITATLREGILSLVKAGGISLYQNEGKMEGAHAVRVGDELLETENILVATGSSPARLPIDGIENALTSDDVLSAPVKGKNIVVIGGGVIGMEFASYLSGIGKSVTVIEAMDKILPMFSKEITVQLSSILKSRGIKVVTGAKVIKIEKTAIAYSKNGADETVTCDAVIVAIGRKANLCGLGLESAGLIEGKFLSVDDNMWSGIEGIYAAGDVTGRVQLAHYAASSAIVAVDTMLKKTPSVDLSVCPSCVYTTPEIAVVGDVGFEGAKTGKFLLGANGKYLVNGSNRGFIKVYCNDDDVIVGAELFGNGVTELVGELAIAVKNKLTAHQIASTIHAHPTVCESIAEASEDIFGLATYKK